MKDYDRFKKITRPLKFRNLRLLGQTLLGQTVTSDLIKYKVYNILYKMNLIKRYTYRAEESGRYFDSPDIKLKSVETSNFRAYVRCNLCESFFVEQDYFYISKNGRKKILFVVKDESRPYKRMVCTLSDISIKFGGRYYQIPSKMAIPFFLYTHKYHDFEVSNYKQVTIDPSKLFKLCGKYLLNTFNRDEISYTYDRACADFTRTLSGFTIKDLEVE